MGMRIHKVLCYALGDVRCDEDKYIIIDDRFSDWVRDKETHSDGIYGVAQEKFPGFLAWVKESMEEADDIVRDVCGVPMSASPGFDKNRNWFARVDAVFVHEMKKENKSKWRWQPVHEMEFGDPKVFGFTPMEFHSWYRHDDGIDYYDSPEQDVKKRWLDGIYPYSGQMFLKGTYNESEEFPRFMSCMDYENRTHSHEFAAGSMTDADRKYLENALFMRNTYRPQIPASVILWCHYLNLFKDLKSAVNDFKPLLYTFWC